MAGDGRKWLAAAGGGGLIVSLWAPWFTRRLSSVVVPLDVAPTVSGWTVLGGLLGAVALVTGVAGLAWAVRFGRASGVWLVVPGAITLLAAVAVTVERIGVDRAGVATITTSPSGGLALAVIGAAAVVLAGLVALLRA